MEQRRLGRIGHMSSVLIYGGAALSDVPQEVADRSIALALEAGINHFDTAADYGESDVRLGAWMDRATGSSWPARPGTGPRPAVRSRARSGRGTRAWRKRSAYTGQGMKAPATLSRRSGDSRSTRCSRRTTTGCGSRPSTGATSSRWRMRSGCRMRA